MAQIVEIPGIGPVEFPDGMSDLDMAVAAGKMFADAERTKDDARTCMGNRPTEPARK